MRFLRVLALAASTAPFLALACDVPGTGPWQPRENEGVAPSAIIGGSLDTTHTAVVAVLGQNFSCSGSIIQVANGQGYVLTAAHCCAPGKLPTVVVMGNDYNSGQVFNVVSGSVLADSCYASCPGSTDDVCMLRFSGASAATPTMPAMTPQTDNLAVGTNLTYVGYGITASPPTGGNSKRRSVSKLIGSLDTYFVEYANPAASGTCEGDSGGPAIANINGVDTVAAVTSFGDQACTQLGTSIRTSSVYTHFIAPYLMDQAPTLGACPLTSDCNYCIGNSTNNNCGGSCVATLAACQNDADCGALLDCYNGCSSPACQTDCSTQHVNGLQQYEGVTKCICDTGCVEACGTNLFCKGAHCGIKPPSADDTCSSCTEDNCCEKAWECSIDPNCKKCFTTASPAPACATNAAALAYYQCVTSTCNTCSLHDPTKSTTTATTVGVGTGSGGAGGSGGASQGGAGPATGSGGGNSTSEQTGCACHASSSNDEPLFPLVVAMALGAAAFQRRKSAARRDEGFWVGASCDRRARRAP